MKEVLFRGKCAFNGEWIEGYYYANPVLCFILPIGYEISADLDAIKILPETRGQFTGLTDKSGKKVFEGDVISYTEHPGYLLKSFYAVVSYKDYVASFVYLKLGLDENGCKQSMIHFFNEADEFEEDILPYLEVIGNVYDNPELLSHD